MTALAAAPLRLDDAPGDQGLRKALVAVLAVHGIALGVAATWSGRTPPRPAEQSAIAVDLSPLPAANRVASVAQAAAAASAPARAVEPTPLPAHQPMPIPREPMPLVPTPVAVPIPAARPAAAAPAPTSAPAATSGNGRAGQGEGQGSSANTAPAGAASAAAAASRGGERGGGNAAALWRGRVVAHLDRHKHFPPAAKLMKREGRVHINLMLDRRGRVVSASVDHGSGFKAFDTEALETVHRAEPLPAPPPEVDGDPVPMKASIGFYTPGIK